MRNIYRSLLLIIACATQKRLARQDRLLKVENEVLRSKLPARVVVTEKEKNRLVRFAARLGRALDEIVTIVHPDTLRRWMRESRKRKKPVAAKPGRKSTAESIRKLILKLARETGCGYTRILGVLKTLGIQSLSRNTIKKILETTIRRRRCPLAPRG